MNTEIFDPKVCFAKELRTSWSKNIKTNSSESNRIPISSVGQEICLHFEHAGDDTEWCVGLIPLNKSWTPENLSAYKSITFCYYSEGTKCCSVMLTDENDVDSTSVNVSRRTPVEDAICEIQIPIRAFTSKPLNNTSKTKSKKTETDQSFNINKAKFIKFTGAKEDNFYISRLKFISDDD